MNIGSSAWPLLQSCSCCATLLAKYMDLSFSGCSCSRARCTHPQLQSASLYTVACHHDAHAYILVQYSAESPQALCWTAIHSPVAFSHLSSCQPHREASTALQVEAFQGPKRNGLSLPLLKGFLSALFLNKSGCTGRN